MKNLFGFITIVVLLIFLGMFASRVDTYNEVLVEGVKTITLPPPPTDVSIILTESITSIDEITYIRVGGIDLIVNDVVTLVEPYRIDLIVPSYVPSYPSDQLTYGYYHDIETNSGMDQFIRALPILIGVMVGLGVAYMFATKKG